MVQIYRKQGLAIITVCLDGNNYFHQVSEDYDIYINYKLNAPKWFSLKFPIPKHVIRETDLNKINDLEFEIDCKKYTAKVKFNPKYIYIREKAEIDAKISEYYRNKQNSKK